MDIISGYVESVTGLSWFFVALTTFIFILSAIYGVGYIRHYKTTSREMVLHWSMFFVCYLGMMMLYSTHSLLWFLVGWAMMALGSFACVIFEAEKPVVLKAGMNYFVQSHVGVLLLTIAFMWVYATTDHMEIDIIPLFISRLSEGQQVTWMMLLVAGFGFKAGLIPFHSWLPHAHPAAPSHISGAMSGVIVKAGVYGVIRFGCYISEGHTTIGSIILILAILSALYGILNAADGRDFKRILAYCTIENVGIIFAGIGIAFIAMGHRMTSLAYIGFMAALLHTLNHAIFKTSLFFTAGNVYVATHTRDIDRLGGLIRYMPKTAFLFLISAIGIGGLPPFGGFISEIMLYSSFLQGMRIDYLPISVMMALSGAALAIVGGASMLCFTKCFGVMFLGTQRDETAKPHLIADETGEESNMLLPTWVLLPVMVFIVICPGLICNFLESCITQLFPYMPIDATAAIGISDMIETLRNISIASLILVGIIGLLLIWRHFTIKRRPFATGATWGCGYLKSIKGIQYTGQSFSGSLSALVRFVLPKTSQYEQLQPEEIFPTRRSLLTISHDAIEKSAVAPLSNSVVNFLKKFQWLMNGQLQRYIVYGLITILMLVIAAII